MRGTIEERFWSKVDVRGEDDCWLWRAGRFTSGYGSFKFISKQNKRAHVVAYILTHGQKENLGNILHSCDVPLCCNPNHLREGTHLENMQEMNAKNRRTAAKGEQNGSALLTEEKVREILALKNTGRTLKQVGALYGVTYATISLIWRGKTWKHLHNEGLLPA